jgi:tRNA pseudouridine38-40 synthase
MTERRRIRLVVRYDGRDFAGSQLQAGRRTVAGTLKAELENLLGEPVKLDFASRTDSGVHADGNVCALAAAPRFPSEKLPRVLNPRLPWDLEVRSAQDVAADFSPRFDALARTYTYRVFRSRDIPVDRRRYVAPYLGPWDEAKVGSAMRVLVGRHSFAAFSKTNEDPQNCICHVLAAETTERGPEVEWVFTANRFLRHMIVRLAGTLLEIAAGRLKSENLRRALDGQRDFKLRPAPAQGLTLTRIEYPEQDLENE